MLLVWILASNSNSGSSSSLDSASQSNSSVSSISSIRSVSVFVLGLSLGYESDAILGCGTALVLNLVWNWVYTLMENNKISKNDGLHMVVTNQDFFFFLRTIDCRTTSATNFEKDFHMHLWMCELFFKRQDSIFLLSQHFMYRYIYTSIMS